MVQITLTIKLEVIVNEPCPAEVVGQIYRATVEDALIKHSAREGFSSQGLDSYVETMEVNLA